VHECFWLLQPKQEGEVQDWVAHVLHALAWMVPGDLAVFGLDDLERAKEWAAG
jgi:hypothetical protein